MVRDPSVPGKEQTAHQGATEPWLNLAAWVECTEVEGPGRRFALWTQGCLLRCPGCCNPHMFELKARHLVPARTVCNWIEEAHRKHDLEGITLLGGEPLLQARGLALVAASARRLGLSVMLFTGYTLDQLRHLDLPGTGELLAQCDVVVDGPFRADQPETIRNWVGSANQRFHYLTDRYDSSIETDPRYRPSLEFRILADGTVQLVGHAALVRRRFV